MKKPAVLLFLALLAAIAGCDSKPTLYSARTYPPKSLISERVEGTSPWKVRLYTTPEEPRADQETRFQLSVLENGQVVHGAQANVRLVMPLMDMGKSEFMAKENAAGIYEGVGRFTMDDEWEVFVTVTKDGKKGTHVFNVRVAE